ncbi:WD repeat, SAM and U-box domain-containing protein 1-like [Ostrinia furnacalis]|uniref:WD repeat, SAM and U-box domain-containing protein 1-like n=1 Tax=Ostrinia furnacalis TaxID=93504 RepID=UPI00103B32AC|nr:WD repeat, SAM and U-box domain-containing protein 1-like [Ostrinia furnacalis]
MSVTLVLLRKSHDDGVLCVWHVARACVLARLAAHEGALHAVAAPAGGALLLTACTEGVLKVFDLVDICRGGNEETNPTPLTWIDGAHDLGAMCADANESGRAAATGGHDAKIQLWRATRDDGGRWALGAAGALEGHAATVTSLRWAGGADADALLASASLDRTARLWQAASGTCVHIVQAHPRYLTCVALAYDLQYMITGSNDKSLRMWSLGSLTIDDELEPACAALAHFGLGDLEGIGPVDDDELDDGGAEGGEGEADENGSRRVWHERAHSGPINCISVHGDLFSTASSDGQVRVYRWAGAEGAEGAAAPLQALAAHEYPALTCALGAGGALLLSAGLDGCALLWDVQMGIVLRSLMVPSGNGAGGDSGGGGVRGARISPHRPPLLLLATDDGLAPIWNLADPDPHPLHIYGGHAEAATCCAWSSDGRILATGATSGELVIHAAPPTPCTLHQEPQAHDLAGVQSCDFAANGSVPGMPDGEGSYLLATAGADSLVRLWLIEIDEEAATAQMRMVRVVHAHGGGASCVRWGGAGLLASAGGDRWARVWRGRRGEGEGGAGGEGVQLRALAAVPAGGAGGAPAVALLDDADGGSLVAVGTLSGELALWRLPAEGAGALDDDADAPRFWDEAGVVRWLREYVTRAPGMGLVSAELAVETEEAARAAALSGARLLDDAVPDLLAAVFGCSEDEESAVEEKSEEAQGRAALRARLRDELEWLRRAPPPPALHFARIRSEVWLGAQARSAPHALLCPLSHRLLREPARAADGFSYERRALREWLVAGGSSPLSGRRLRNARLHPNYALRDALRAFLRDQAGDE